MAGYQCSGGFTTGDTGHLNRHLKTCAPISPCIQIMTPVCTYVTKPHSAKYKQNARALCTLASPRFFPHLKPKPSFATDE